ncbi:hypothetical protein [Actinomadura sp. WMMB 499]|uniref:hypothetical protein n=1 Tax=Actinomadura sp. WMMB 499 TaxID=1219491 RepID=UPI001246102C|nr:hypothetical protein [Actinomadura sp. WMMB 499]QFG23820.1 hypothetical protein F7P10_24565 [Actinomadura sp. WMMB 499]
MGLGLAPHTIVLIVATALAVVGGLLYAMRQEQADRRALERVSAEVGRMELPEIRRLVRQGLVAPNPQFWHVLEDGLVRFRPGDRDEEVQRQRLLQEVRMRLMP